MRRIATFIEYKTNNAEIIEFQSYRIVQVKTPVMQSYDIAYKWSGDSTTKATSDLQTFELLSDKAESPQGIQRQD